MKSFFLVAIIILCSSCSVKYGLLAGVQQESYTESVDAKSIFSEDEVRLPDYQNKSKGFHFGISEESNYFLTKIFYYQNSYSDKEYEASGETYNTSLSEKGFAGTIALKIWWLQPHIGFKKYNSTYEIDEITSKDKYSTITYGLDLEIPLSENAFIYTGYSVGEQTNFEAVGSALVTQVIKHQELKLGLRWNFASFGSNGSKSASASKE